MNKNHFKTTKYSIFAISDKKEKKIPLFIYTSTYFIVSDGKVWKEIKKNVFAKNSNWKTGEQKQKSPSFFLFYSQKVNTFSY